jgi:phosphoserine phosphatase
LPHIEDIKRHKARGHLVCVWSAGGSEWAEAAVKALKLEKYVDLVIAKPTWVIDDLEPNQFLKRVPFKEAQK